MYASNWPVELLNAKDYTTIYNTYTQLIEDVVQNEDKMKCVLQYNCEKIYGV